MRRVIGNPWVSDGQPITAVSLTPLGGLAVGFINKTGAPSIKGSVVHVHNDTAIDGAVELSVIGIPDPIGVIYDSGVPDGGRVRVVVAGIAEVLLVNAGTRGHLIRTFISADPVKEAGKAISEAVPTAPFATDKHFCEIGHSIQSTSGPGLCRVVLHFN